ncbi:hypothetical protein BGZ63DRAFT_167821 [Mariannaea sp. PMI_226]|nr:hypothetical protein BGZ63DRAFT_167821 [Mariannaea sp. PMI_226]
MSRSSVPQKLDAYYDEIRKAYLVDGWGLNKLMIEFEERHGLTATKNQWTYKLKEWGLQKNISKEGWVYVRHQNEKRKREGKETDVILSGVRLPMPKVRKGIDNHCFESTWDKLNKKQGKE